MIYNKNISYNQMNLFQFYDFYFIKKQIIVIKNFILKYKSTNFKDILKLINDYLYLYFLYYQEYQNIFDFHNRYYKYLPYILYLINSRLFNRYFTLYSNLYVSEALKN